MRDGADSVGRGMGWGAGAALGVVLALLVPVGGVHAAEAQGAGPAVAVVAAGAWAADLIEAFERAGWRPVPVSEYDPSRDWPEFAYVLEIREETVRQPGNVHASYWYGGAWHSVRGETVSVRLTAALYRVAGPRRSAQSRLVSFEGIGSDSTLGLIDASRRRALPVPPDRVSEGTILASRSVAMRRAAEALVREAVESGRLRRVLEQQRQRFHRRLAVRGSEVWVWLLGAQPGTRRQAVLLGDGTLAWYTPGRAGGRLEPYRPPAPDLGGGAARPEADADLLRLAPTFVQTEHYDFYSTETRAFTEQLSQYMEFIYREYEKGFASIIGTKGDAARRHVVLLFSTRQEFIEHGGGEEGMVAYYSPKRGWLVGYRSGSLEDTYPAFFHEGLHQFLRYYLEDPPMWLNEGLACYFETAQPVAGGLRFPAGGGDRMVTAARALRRGDITPLRDLLRMGRDEFYASDPRVRSRHYAEAYSFVLFLIEHDRERLTGYLAALAGASRAGGPPPPLAEGKALERLEAGWHAMLRQAGDARRRRGVRR